MNGKHKKFAFLLRKISLQVLTIYQLNFSNPKVKQVLNLLPNCARESGIKELDQRGGSL